MESAIFLVYYALLIAFLLSFVFAIIIIRSSLRLKRLTKMRQREETTSSFRSDWAQQTPVAREPVPSEQSSPNRSENPES